MESKHKIVFVWIVVLFQLILIVNTSHATELTCSASPNKVLNTCASSTANESITVMNNYRYIQLSQPANPAYFKSSNTTKVLVPIDDVSGTDPYKAIVSGYFSVKSENILNKPVRITLELKNGGLKYLNDISSYKLNLVNTDSKQIVSSVDISRTTGTEKINSVSFEDIMLDESNMTQPYLQTFFTFGFNYAISLEATYNVSEDEVMTACHAMSSRDVDCTNFLSVELLGMTVSY